MDTRRRLKPQDYTVAWLCALPKSEQVAAIGMLDEMHEDLLQPPGDDNTYTYGSIKGHNIIIACLPFGQPGTISASILVGSLPKSFPNLRIHMFVGIGGGIPHDPPPADPEKDIHLGDVVVGVIEKTGVSGVVQYDFERDHGPGNRELLSSLDKPHRRLVTALGKLVSLDLLGKSNFNLHMERLKSLKSSKMDFTRPTFHDDRLYKSSYVHVDAGPDSTGCDSCHGDGLILRSERLSPHPVVHQGQILSGNAVIKNTPRRDELSQRFPEARCIEMEAAGVMDQTHCLVIRGIADYADSHKNEHWQPYAAGTAAAFAREFLLIIQPYNVTDIDPIAFSQTRTPKDPPHSAVSTEDNNACLQSLYFAEMYWRRNDVADPVPSTCAWLLEHPTYCEWLGQDHGMLWIKGKPGAGKSTVLKHALETAEREIEQAVTLASFFFHGRGASLQKNVLGLFRSLLHQILKRNRNLLSKLTSIYKRRCETEGEFGKKWNWHEKQLQTFFKQHVVDAARTHKIRIYIDALDECGEDIAVELVEFFRRFTTPISICFSCRHYPFVALEGGNEIWVEQENAQDIKRYINDKIDTHVQQIDFAQIIRSEMVSRSKGNFQWVVLVLPRVLKMHKSRKSLLAIQTMIGNIPAELDELYTKLLQFVDDYERAQSLRLLQWIAFAFRPLNLRELRLARVVGADTTYKSLRECRKSELYVDTDEDMERIVCDLSKGLAEVVGNDSERVAQFVHQSVKDFLLERGGFQILDHACEGTVVGRGHFWLSRSCIKYMSMREIQSFATTLEEVGWDEVDVMKWADYLSWLKYSASFWLEHAGEVEKAKIPQVDLLALNRAPENSDPYSWPAFYQVLRSWEPGVYTAGSHLLHLASGYGLLSVVNAMLPQMVCVDQIDGDHRTPLSIAACNGHKDVVGTLLDSDDVDVNSRDTEGDTPLSLAAQRGYENVVKMLITRDDVDVDSRNMYDDTPLALAAQGGYEAIVKMLITRDDVDVNSRNICDDTPLSLAAERGHEAIVKMLLNWSGVDVNPENVSGLTPISKAAAKEHISVAKLLLEQGPNLKIANHQLDMVIKETASHGFYGTMKLLFQDIVDVGTRDKIGRTLLFYAASHGHYHIVTLLLQQKVDPDIRGSEGRTPLSYAASSGHPATVKLLVQYNADIDSKDIQGRTPLSCVAYKGYLATVKLLLQHNADVDSKDIEGRTPLSYAASHSYQPYGYLDTFNLLIQYSTDIDSKDDMGRTPLSYAASSGYLAVVKLLIQHNADINSKDIEGRTPLSYAASRGDSEVVKLLLKGVSNADQRDEDGRTPLSYAVSFGNREVAEAILERTDININSKDNDGRSPLSWALLVWSIRNVPVVKLLLKQDDIVVTEKDRDLMEKESEHLEVDFSLSEEEEGEEESERESEEESEEAGSEAEQNSKARSRDWSRSDSERPRKRIRTGTVVLSD